MPDPVTPPAENAGANNNGAASGANGNEPGKNGNAPSTTPEVDFSKLSDEQLSKVLEDPRTFNLPRIKELREAAKKAKDYETEQAKANEDKLIKEKKFDEVLQQKEARIKELEGKLQTGQLDNVIRDELTKAGVKNVGAGLKLLDRANLKMGEDGKIEGLEAAIKGFSQQYPELLNSANTSVGSATNPGNPGSGEPIKASDLRNSTFYNDPKNAEAIRLVRLGKLSVIDD